jgi:hypothetical protein
MDLRIIWGAGGVGPADDVATISDWAQVSKAEGAANMRTMYDCNP